MPMNAWRHCCVVLIASAAMAQDAAGTKPQVTSADLAANDPAKVAWAAHHAGGSGDAKLVVPLRKALREWSGSPSTAHQQTCVHILDALIRLDAKVPAIE